MMPSTHRFDNRARRRGGFTRRGFTLTEMLVVIGIIVLVVSLLMPMVARAWRRGGRARAGRRRARRPAPRGARGDRDYRPGRLDPDADGGAGLAAGGPDAHGRRPPG